jgi:hypothetical protein
MGTYEGIVPIDDEDDPCIVCGDEAVNVTFPYKGGRVGLCGDCDTKAEQEFVDNHALSNLN